MSGLRLAAGQCTADVSILLVGQALLHLSTLAARSRVCGDIQCVFSPAGAPRWQQVSRLGDYLIVILTGVAKSSDGPPLGCLLPPSHLYSGQDVFWGVSWASGRLHAATRSCRFPSISLPLKSGAWGKHFTLSPFPHV